MVFFRIEAGNTMCESPTTKETHKFLLSDFTTATIAKTKTLVSAVKMTIENAFLRTCCAEPVVV